MDSVFSCIAEYSLIVLYSSYYGRFLEPMESILLMVSHTEVILPEPMVYSSYRTSCDNPCLWWRSSVPGVALLVNSDLA